MVGDEGRMGGEGRVEESSRRLKKATHLSVDALVAATVARSAASKVASSAASSGRAMVARMAACWVAWRATNNKRKR